MSPEETQAESLARWLEQPPGTPPPEDVDIDVLEAMYALRPELAPAPRLSVDDILGSVTAGPLAAPAPADVGRARPAQVRNDLGDAAPVPVAANRPPSRMGWLLGGGVAAVLAAAMVLVAVVPMALRGASPTASEVATLDLEEAPSLELHDDAAAPMARTGASERPEGELAQASPAREKRKELSLDLIGGGDSVASAEPEPDPPPPAGAGVPAARPSATRPAPLADADADAVADLDDFAYEARDKAEDREAPADGARFDDDMLETGTALREAQAPAAPVSALVEADEADEAESVAPEEVVAVGRSTSTRGGSNKASASASTLSTQAAPRGPLSAPAAEAKALLDQGRAADAVTATEASLQRTDLQDSARADLNWVQGLAYQTLGNDRRARRALEEALRLRAE